MLCMAMFYSSFPAAPLTLRLQADIRGVFAQVFCDFGPAFEVLDVDGEARLHAAEL